MPQGRLTNVTVNFHDNEIVFKELKKYSDFIHLEDLGSLLLNQGGLLNEDPTKYKTDDPRKIILLDEKVDHGPILAQEVVAMPEPIPRTHELEDMLAHLGGKLLAETIPQWLANEIDPQEQDHARATFTNMLKKEDGLLNLNDNDELNYRKFLAYSDWPSVYFFKNGKRIKITDAEFKDGTFVIKKVIPEGKKEMNFLD